MKEGQVVVVRDEGGGFFAGVIKKLMPVVWEEGCDLEGDVEIQECGNAKSNIKGKIEPKWVSDVRPEKRAKGKQKAPQQVDTYQMSRPGKNSRPVLLVIWYECVIAWGRPVSMLTGVAFGGKLKAHVFSPV